MSTTSEIDTKPVCAVMVIHHPEPQLADRLPAIQAQCGQLVIVNNGCDEGTRQNLAALSGLHWIDSPENNLALAQNLGIHYARNGGFSYVLLLDQDSHPAADMVSRLVHAHQEHPAGAAIGLVAPAVTDRHTQRHHDYVSPWLHFGFRRQRPSDNDIMADILWVIASGSLIPLHVLDQVGLMDERYGIDYVDKEFCLRLISRGWKIVVTPQARLEHAIGRCSDHQLAGLTVTATNHPPARRYTIYRNRLRTIGRYGLPIPSFLIYECCGIAYDTLRIVCFETEKQSKLSAIAAGVRAALLGESTD